MQRRRDTRGAGRVRGTDPRRYCISQSALASAGLLASRKQIPPVTVTTAAFVNTVLDASKRMLMRMRSLGGGFTELDHPDLVSGF